MAVGCDGGHVPTVYHHGLCHKQWLSSPVWQGLSFLRSSLPGEALTREVGEVEGHKPVSLPEGCMQLREVNKLAGEAGEIRRLGLIQQVALSHRTDILFFPRKSPKDHGLDLNLWLRD